MPLPRMQTPTSSRRAFSDVDSEDKHERLSFSPAPSLPLQLPLPTSSPLTITTSATTAINGSSDAVTPRRRSTPTPLVIDSNAYGGKLSEEQKEERKRKKKSSLKRSSTNTKDDDHSTSTAAAAHTPLSLTPASHISTPATTSTPIATAPTKPSFLSPPSSINSVRFAQRIAELRSPNTTSPTSSSASSPLYRPSDSDNSDGVDGGVGDDEDVELDLDMIGPDDAELSDDGELDSPPSLMFEESSMAGSGAHSHSVSTAASVVSSSSSVTAPPYALFLSFVSLAIAVLSMSAVGPMFLFLEKEKEVPPLLAACWRCQAMLIFMIVPTAVEWYHLSVEERSWSHLHVPPSPTVDEGGGELPQPAVGVSPKHRKGVPSMIEMNDVNRIDAFLDDQSAAAASADETSATDSGRRPAVAEDNDEYPSYPVHSSDTYPSSFTPRGADGKRHLRIETVKVQSKMRLVHVSWYVLLVGLTWGASLALWVGALCFTSTARASLFGSTYPLILLCWMRWKGVQVSWMEMAGVVVALVGIVISEVVGYFTATERIVDEPPPALDITASTPTADSGSCQVVNGSSTQLIGDLMMILGSFINALNIVYASRARRVLRLFTYTLSTTTIVTICLVLLSALAEHSPADFSSHGLFGWLADLDMLLMISAFGFVVGCIGVLGQNYAVRYTSPVVFSTAQLLDPGLTAFMSWLAGLEKLPSVSTGIGVLVVGVGIAGVVLGEYGRRKEQESVHSYHAVSVQSDEQPH